MTSNPMQLKEYWATHFLKELVKIADAKSQLVKIPDAVYISLTPDHKES